MKALKALICFLVLAGASYGLEPVRKVPVPGNTDKIHMACPEYVPGQIIVKMKTGRSLSLRQGSLFVGGDDEKPLDCMNKYPVVSVRPITFVSDRIGNVFCLRSSFG